MLGLLADRGRNVGVLEQERSELGRAGQPAEREGAEQVGGCPVVLRPGGEDLGDPGDRRVDPGGVTAGDPGDHGAQPDRVGPGQGDMAPVLLGAAALLMGGPVGLDDLGLGDRDHPRRRLPGDRPGHGVVDQADHVDRQVPGHRRDLARQPRIGLQRQDHRPRARQPVLQVEDVSGHRPGGEGVDAAGDAELAQRQLPDPGRPLAADLIQAIAPRGSRQPGQGSRVEPGIGAVETGPVRHQQQVLDLGCPTPKDAVLDRGERRRGVEVVDRVGGHTTFYSNTCSNARFRCRLSAGLGCGARTSRTTRSVTGTKPSDP